MREGTELAAGHCRGQADRPGTGDRAELITEKLTTQSVPRLQKLDTGILWKHLKRDLILGQESEAGSYEPETGGPRGGADPAVAGRGGQHPHLARGGERPHL